jgi:polygalacturonase
MDYGAVGDGLADDTAAINKAMSDGSRCGVNCAGSTVKGAVVYFPIGTYRVSSSIVSYYNTQIVGEINSDGNIPTIQAATTFTGNGVISSDVYLADGTTEWYINTVSLKLLYIDISNY